MHHEVFKVPNAISTSLYPSLQQRNKEKTIIHVSGEN